MRTRLWPATASIFRKCPAQRASILFTRRRRSIAKLDGIMPQVASMGASVSIVDFDRDGWPDIYVTNSEEGSKNALYRNMHDGTFKDVAPELGIADVNQPGTGVSMGAVWGDYDNDGYEDLFLIKWGRPELYHNDHGHGFTRVSEQAGLPQWINANTAVWFDYDGDGLLDLFVGGYYSEDLDLGISTPRESCRTVLSTPKTAAANISFTIWAMASLKK